MLILWLFVFVDRPLVFFDHQVITWRQVEAFIQAEKLQPNPGETLEAFYCRVARERALYRLRLKDIRQKGYPEPTEKEIISYLKDPASPISPSLKEKAKEQLLLQNFLRDRGVLMEKQDETALKEAYKTLYPEGNTPYAEVREQIKQVLQAQRIKAFLDQWDAELLEAHPLRFLGPCTSTSSPLPD